MFDFLSMGTEECSFYEVERRYVEEEGSNGSNTREFDDINERKLCLG